MSREASPPRPTVRLTRSLLGYALADMFGLFCLGLGVYGCIGGTGRATIVFGLGPTSWAEAIALLLGGAAVMAWAMSRLMREILRQTTGSLGR